MPRRTILQASRDPFTVGAMEIDVLPDATMSLAIPSITHLVAGTVHLVCQGTPGTAYRIECSPDLNAGSWTMIEELVR